MSVFKEYFVVQTEYFDFIFAEESEVSVRHLASCADDLYREASAKLNFTKKMRIPVLLTRKTEVFNAYFTTLPYNRIVLYDSAPPASFSVFSDTLVSVFYHELVHALSLNIRSSFWEKYSSAFGDAFMPSFMLNLPLSFVEGAAVSFESMDGQGRLNDSYSLHILRQAKLENKFPDWRDVTGAYGLYTDGSLPYIFGGAFSAYIQQTYGMDKYAEFWKESGKLHFFKLSAGIFKKVYGLSLSQAWKDFKTAFPVPLCKIGIPSPLFAPTSYEYKTGENGSRLYANLTSSASGFAWYDQASSSVMFSPAPKEGCEQDSAHANRRGKRLVLCVSDLSDRLVFSRSGNFLALSGLRGRSGAKYIASVYDMQKKRFIFELSGLRQACVIELQGDKKILAGIEREDAGCVLSMYDFDESSVDTGTARKRIRFAHGILPLEPVDAGNGRLICVLKHQSLSDTRQVCSLFLYDFHTDSAHTYEFSDETLFDDFNPSLRFPSVHKDVLYLSCAVNAFSQPVLAFCDLNALQNGSTPVLSVQRSQYSGGVFYPAVFEGGFAFISRFYEKRRLSFIDKTGDCYNLKLQALPFDCAPTATQRFAVTKKGTAGKNGKSSVSFKRYRPLKYLKKGVLIPFAGFLTADSFGPYAPKTIPLGVTAVTGDLGEHFLFAAGSGIDVQTRNFNSNASLAFTEYPVGIAAGFYTEAGINTGLQRSAARFHIDFDLPFISDFSRIYAANTSYFLYNAEDTSYMHLGYAFVNRMQLGMGCTFKTGMAAYDRIGFSSGIHLFAKKSWSIYGRRYPSWNFSPIVEGRLILPFLLPFRNPRRFTLNLPFSCTGLAYINACEQWKFESRHILFAYDIQKPLSFMPLFFRRICLDGGIHTTWYKDGKTDFFVDFSLFSTLVFNSGAPTSYPVDAGVSVRWDPFGSARQNFKIMLKLAFSN